MEQGQQILRLLIALRNGCEEILKRAITDTGEKGLRPTAAEVLVLFPGGRPTVGVLEGIIGGNPSYSLDCLVEHGLVQRERPTFDRRICEVSLTADGERVRNALLASIEIQTAEIEPKIGDLPERLERLRAAMAHQDA
jgi:hypothetical protein